jgi:hypothetical protein
LRPQGTPRSRRSCDPSEDLGGAGQISISLTVRPSIQVPSSFLPARTFNLWRTHGEVHGGLTAYVLVPLLEQSSSSTVILIPLSRAALSSAPGGIMAMGGDGFAGALRERIFCAAGWPGCWSGIHTGMSSRCRAPRALAECLNGSEEELASLLLDRTSLRTVHGCLLPRPVQCRAQLRELDALAAAQSTITRIQKPTRSQGSVRRVDIFVISCPSRSGAAPRYSGRPRSATDRHSHTGRPHWMHHHHHRK